MSEPCVRPDVRAFLEMLAANPRPMIDAARIPHIRAITPEMMAAMSTLDLPVGELGEVRNVAMRGPGGEIALRLFDARAEREPGPVVVFYHGGGYVVGSIDTHAGLAAEIARQLDLPVVSVEYRLAPENPWPAAPDDAEAAARWIAANAGAFGREFTSLVLCGDSAGGTMTIITALALRDRPAALPVLAQLAIYPKVDFTKDYPSDQQFSDGFGLHRVELDYYFGAYACDPRHWRGSPLLADQSGLPPTLVVTASLDPLRDNGRAYACAAIVAGVDTTYREMKGAIHGFCSYRAAIPSAPADLTEIMDIAREIIAKSRKDLVK